MLMKFSRKLSSVDLLWLFLRHARNGGGALTLTQTLAGMRATEEALCQIFLGSNAYDGGGGSSGRKSHLITELERFVAGVRGGAPGVSRKLSALGHTRIHFSNPGCED